MPFRTWCEQEGLPYTTMRGHAGRGQTAAIAERPPVFRIGRRDYINVADGARWLETLKAAGR